MSLILRYRCTSFATVIIITRLLGRKVRSDTLFREDWITMLSLPPLWIRMVFVHMVLIYGTNNVDTVGHTYTEEQIRHRTMGARLVLAARIFYAMFSKFCPEQDAWNDHANVYSLDHEAHGLRIFEANHDSHLASELRDHTAGHSCVPIHHFWCCGYSYSDRVSAFCR